MSNLVQVAEQLKENNKQNMEGHLLVALELEKLNSKMKSFLDMLKNQQLDMLEMLREQKDKTEQAGQGPAAPKADSGGYGKIIAGIAALAGGILAGIADSLKAYAKLFRLDDLMKSIKPLLTSLKSRITTSLTELFKPIRAFFASKGGQIAAIIDDLKVRAFVLFDDALKFMDDLLKPVRDLFTNPEGRVAKFFRMITAPFRFPFEGLIDDAIKPFKSIFMAGEDGASTIGKIVTRIKAPFDAAIDAAGKATDMIRGAFSVFSEGSALMKSLSAIGRIIGRLFYPITLIMTVWDTVKGAIQGFEDEGFIGAIQGAITGLINGVIGAPLDLLKDIMAWALGKFGFDSASEALKGFSVQDFIARAIDTIFDIFKNVINGIIELAASAIESIPLIGEGIGDKIRSFKFDTNVQERKALDKQLEQAKADDESAKKEARAARNLSMSDTITVDGRELTGQEKADYIRNKKLGALKATGDAAARLEQLKAERAALETGKSGVNIVNAPSTSTSTSSSTTPMVTTTPSAMDFSDPMLAGA
jgi:phage-related protein